MFKRCVAIVFLILLASQAVEARKKKNVAGSIKGGTYQDATHGFQVTLPDNFKPKVHKAKTFYRLTLVQDTLVLSEAIIERSKKNALLTPARPLLEIWVVETPCSPRDVLDTLLSDQTKSDWRERLLNTIDPPYLAAQFDAVKEGSFSKTKSGPLKGTRWTGAFGYVAPSLEYLKTDLNVSLVCQTFDQETVLVLVMRTEKEWLDLTIAASKEILASLKIPSDED